MPGFLDQLNADLAGLDENKPKSGNFTRGLKQSWEETKGTGYGIVGLGGALASKANIPYADEVKNWGLENAQAKFDASEKLGQETDQLEGINSVGDAGKYLSHGLGYVAGQAVPSLVTGGAGALIGKQLVKQGIKRAVTKEAGELIAQKAAERGAIAGAGVASYGQEAGSIYPDMVKDGHDEPGRAALFAVPAAALDVIPEMRLAKEFTGGIKRDAETSLFKYAAKEVPRQAAMEGVTEGLQSVVERAAGYKSLNDKEAWSDYLNSGALGVLGGGAAGAIATPFVHARVSPQALANKMNETSVLNPPTQAEIDAEFKARQPELFDNLPPPPIPPAPPPNVPPGTQLGLFGENTPPPGPALAVPTPVVTPSDPRKEMIGQVRGAFEQALTSVGTTPNKGQVTRAVGQITSGVNTAEEVADRLDAQVKELAASGKKENVARAETLAIWRDNLRGVPEAERQGVVGQTAAASPVQAAPEQTAPVEGQTANEFTAEQLFEEVGKQVGERNLQIYRESALTSKTEIAKKYGISKDRVKDIRQNVEIKAAKIAKDRGLTLEQIVGQRAQAEAAPTISEAAAENEGLTVPQGKRKDTGLSDLNSSTSRALTAIKKKGLKNVEEGTLHTALIHHFEEAQKEGQAPGEAAKHIATLTEITAEVQRRDKIRKAEGAEAAHVEETDDEENDDASEVREDQGQPGQERKEPEGRKDRGGKNLQQPAQARAETSNAEKPIAPKRVLKKKAPEAAAPTPSPIPSREEKAATKEGEVVAQAATPETSTKSTLEQAGEAWNANKAANHPAWESLTKAQQKTFADYGPENWTKEDVANEAKKLTPAATPESVPPMYYTRTPVEARVYDEETNQYDMEQMPAKEALDHIEHDIGTMNLLLNCLRSA